jgi:type VI secretion system secreted protein Hcp
MNKKILASVSMLALVVVYMLPFSVNSGKIHEASASQSDYYLKIEGIDGESMVHGHKGEMQLNSWSFGASNPTTVGSGSGLSGGKVQFQDFHFTKSVDKATPKLFLACASGKHIPKLTLTVERPSTERATTFMTYTFMDVMCTSFQNSADPLVEAISFNYAKITMEYTPTHPDGSAGERITAGWDLKANKGI